jgi:hypothetical protein
LHDSQAIAAALLADFQLKRNEIGRLGDFRGNSGTAMMRAEAGTAYSSTTT